jgi:hypothetical protein
MTAKPVDGCTATSLAALDSSFRWNDGQRLIQRFLKPIQSIAAEAASETKTAPRGAVFLIPHGARAQCAGASGAWA